MKSQQKRNSFSYYLHNRKISIIIYKYDKKKSLNSFDNNAKLDVRNIDNSKFKGDLDFKEDDNNLKQVFNFQ